MAIAFFDTSNFFQATRYGWGLHFFVAVVALILANLIFWVGCCLLSIPIIVVAAVPSTSVTVKAIVGGVLGGVILLVILCSWLCILLFCINVIFGVVLLIIWLVKQIRAIVRRYKRRREVFQAGAGQEPAAESDFESGSDEPDVAKAPASEGTGQHATSTQMSSSDDDDDDEKSQSSSTQQSSSSRK